MTAPVPVLRGYDGSTSGTITVMAPQGVFLDAIGSTLNGGLWITSEVDWRCKQGGALTGPYPQLRGFSAGFFFDGSTTGSHTLELTVRNGSGDAATQTRAVTVNADTRTYQYVAPPGDGGDDGNPGTIGSPKATIAAAFAALPSSADIGIQLKRGGTYAQSASINLTTTKGNNFVIRDWGSGAKPIIDATAITCFSSSASHDRATLLNVDFISSTAADYVVLQPAAGTTRYCVVNCDCDANCLQFAYFNLVSPPAKGLIVQNCDAPSGVGNYFVWIAESITEEAYLTVIDCFCLKSDNGAGGGERPMRGSGKYITVAMCDFRNEGKSAAHFMRMQYLTCWRTNFEIAVGGTTPDNTRIGPLDEPDDGDETALDYLIDRCTFKRMQASPRRGISRLCFRSCVFDDDASPSVQRNVRTDSSVAARDTHLYYHCTFLTEQAIFQFIHYNFTGELTGLELVNCLCVSTAGWDADTDFATFHIQSADGGSTEVQLLANNVFPVRTDLPGGNSFSFVNATHPGVISGWIDLATLNGLAFADANQQADVTLDSGYRPEDGSAAAGAGMAIPWITDDYNGNARSASAPTAGAVETATCIEESIAQDTFIAESPLTNPHLFQFGTVGFRSLMGSIFRSLLRFSISEIPRGSTIVSVNLQLVKKETVGTPPDHQIARITQLGWVAEATAASWTNYAPGQAWAVEGGDFTTTDQFVFSPGTGPGALNLSGQDLIDQVQTALDAGTTVDFIVKQSDEANNSWVDYWSSEAEEPANRPLLTVCYAPPASKEPEPPAENPLDLLPTMGVGT